MGFGWAYVDCGTGGASSGGAAGPSGSLQFMTASSGEGTGISSGSLNLTFKDNQKLELTGTLHVNGVISASQYHIEDIAIVHASGSTNFGNSDDDVHARTGSISVRDSLNVVQFETNTAGNGRTFMRGMIHGIQAVNTTHFTASNPVVILGITQTGSVRILIPSPVSTTAGGVLLIKDQVTSSRGGDNIIITSAASASIDGNASYILTGSMPAISLYTDGTNWFVF